MTLVPHDDITTGIYWWHDGFLPTQKGLIQVLEVDESYLKMMAYSIQELPHDAVPYIIRREELGGYWYKASIEEWIEARIMSKVEFPEGIDVNISE